MLAGYAQLAHAAAEHPRVIAVTVAPDTRDNADWLAWAILEQLGKDPDLTRGVNGKDSWSLAELWLEANETLALLVIGVERLTVRLWRKLAELSHKQDLVVWLIPQFLRLTRGQRELLAHPQSPITTISDGRFLDWAREASSHRPPKPRAKPVTPFLFPAVPADEQPFFRDTCRRLLSSEDFAVVDDAYRHAFTHTMHWLRRPPAPLLEEHAGAYLADLVRNARGLHDQLTRLRGAQAAFWRHRWLLKIRPDTLAAAYRVTPHGIDRDAAIALLNAYASPRTAALGALALRTQLPPARIALINADQLTQDCRVLHLGDEEPVRTDTERVLLYAQLLDTYGHNQRAAGPLFRGPDLQRMRPHTIQQILRRTATETGLPLTQTWTPPTDRQHAFWMHRRGLTLQPLAPPGARL